MGIALCAPSSQGHIVPPEDLHPTAESFRRIEFFLNLNPVPWNLVAEDVDLLETQLTLIAPTAATRFRSAVGGDMDLIDPEKAETPMDSGASREAARRVFRESTMAVAATLLAYLDSAEHQLKDTRTASSGVETARRVWASFEHEIRYSDPIAFRKLGKAWLELSSALLMSVKAKDEANPGAKVAFEEAATSIRDYVNGNFGPGFEMSESGRLRALPRGSDTFQADAAIPVKLPPGHNMNKQLPRPRQLLNMAERGIDEKDTILIALGDMAFDSPYIFGEPARSLQISCNTCHNKSITNPGFIIPGLSVRAGGVDVSSSFFAHFANNGHFDPLDIPDLRGIRFTAPYGRNGRFDSLLEFVRNVIVNEFNGAEPDPTLLDGLIAYILEFDFLANPYLENTGQLNEEASEAAHRGERIFHQPFDGFGGNSCAGCHVPSANFLDHRRHDIGTVKGSGPFSRDRALDTPTLLGIRYTAPYFHDGSQTTLEGVNLWFNDRFSLGLSEAELKDLTAYVETVGDGIEAYEDTLHTLEAEMEEFSFFLSAYEYLRQSGKSELIEITFSTIALEIHAHKWDVQDSAYLPVLNLMAELMEEASNEQIAGRTKAVDAIVAEYRQLHDEYADRLK